VQWFLFPPGSWLFLDGGELDLGIVRDSTLSATNDFESFAETWEAAAFVGSESLAVTSTVCPSVRGRRRTTTRNASPSRPGCSDKLLPSARVERRVHPFGEVTDDGAVALRVDNVAEQDVRVRRQFERL
jgi:hypothetical protein